MPEPKQPPAATVLAGILQRDYYLGHTPAGMPFAAHYSAPSVLIPITGGGGSLRGRLGADMFTETGRPANSDALTTVVGLASAIAMQSHQVTPVLRVGSAAGSLFLDLGRRDGSAVQLYPGGWQLAQRPPVLFARTAMTGELPLPAGPGRGSLEAARSLVNVDGDDAWAFYVACRIASLIPGITHPVEIVLGQPGTAKTATTRITASWIDPSPAMVSAPRDSRTWATTAASTYVIPLDNVSWVPAWWSDLLCKAVSGDGWVDRALYTDSEVYVAAFQSVIILNSIGFGEMRGDLADRSAVHKLVRPASYRSDSEVDRAWRQAHPEALAWLLDQAAKVMVVMASTPVPGTDRMADFSWVLRSVDHLWRTRCYDHWQRGRLEVYQDAAEADPVAVAIMNAIRGPVTMTSGDLLLHLQRHGGLQDQRHGRAWTPKAMSDGIDRATIALRAIGWVIERVREGGSGRRMWLLQPPA